MQVRAAVAGAEAGLGAEVVARVVEHSSAVQNANAARGGGESGQTGDAQVSVMQQRVVIDIRIHTPRPLRPQPPPRR